MRLRWVDSAVASLAPGFGAVTPAGVAGGFALVRGRSTPADRLPAAGAPPGAVEVAPPGGGGGVDAGGTDGVVPAVAAGTPGVGADVEPAGVVPGFVGGVDAAGDVDPAGGVDAAGVVERFGSASDRPRYSPVPTSATMTSTPPSATY